MVNHQQVEEAEEVDKDSSQTMEGRRMIRSLSHRLLGTRPTWVQPSGTRYWVWLLSPL